MMGEFRKASNEFRSTIESEVEAEKIRDAMRIEPPRPIAPPLAPPGPPTADAPAPEADAGAEPVAPAAGAEPIEPK